MQSLKVKIKKLHDNAIIPSYAKVGDAGLDLTAISYIDKAEYLEYDTGLSFEIPEGYVGLVFPRSSISNKDLDLTNAVGVIDSSYRGPVKFRFRKTSNSPFWQKIYEVGDRVGQLIIMQYPKIELEEAEELSETERGTGGFGSTNA